MSLASDPKTSYAYVLESDRAKAKEKQPVFFFRTLTFTQYCARQKTVSELQGREGPDNIFGAADTLISGVIDNWVNVVNAKGQAIQFDPKGVGDVVSVEEMLELAYAVANQGPSPEDKKKSSSQSTSSSANAGQKSASARKTAKTSRRKSSRRK